MKINNQAYRADGGDIGTDRIKEIAHNPYGDEEKCWLAKRVLALLDELEAEPVAWTDADELRDVKNAGNGYLFAIGGEANKFADPNRQVMLYTAPPAPVSVPDFGALTKCIVQRLVDYGAADDDAIASAEEFVYNACRAAMLQGAENAESPSSNSPVIPDGWVLVPVEPTEHMIVEGFESWPDEFFSDTEVWEAFQEMSGCQQSAHLAKLCWAAMIAAGGEAVSKSEFIQRVAVLAGECHKLACDLDIGDERIEMFEIYEVLRRIQRSGAAGEMLAATNPLLSPGITEDTEWVNFYKEDDA